MKDTCHITMAIKPLALGIHDATGKPTFTDNTLIKVLNSR